MENNTKKYEEFRNQYPEFIYHSYEITDGKDSLTVTYHFEIPGLARFAPVWTFPKPKTAKRREQESFCRENYGAQKRAAGQNAGYCFGFCQFCCHNKQVPSHPLRGDSIPLEAKV